MLNIDDRFLTEATQDQFWLMCHIAQFMNENAACFPSNKTLCERTGWKISKLNEVKKSCIDAAMLKAETRFINARQSTNEYTILTDRLSVMVNLRGKKGKQIPTATTAPCHTGSTLGATLAAPPPTATATTEVLTNNEVLTNEVSVTPAQNFSTLLNTESFLSPGASAARKIETVLDAIEAAEEWVGENQYQMKAWIEIARFSGDTRQELAKFFSHYWRESDPSHRCRTSPIDFFKTGFSGWLINAKTFNRSAPQPAAPQQTLTASPEPRGAAYRPFPKDY